MPAESSRLFHRVGKRDRWFVAIAAGAAIAAAPAAVVFGGQGSSGLPAGCVSRIEPGFMGGQTHTFCGADAVEFCRSQAASGGSVPADCKRTDFVAEPAQP
jgi:hypothetical protein